jgi:hypothetical protein
LLHGWKQRRQGALMVEFVRDVMIAVAVLATVIALALHT